MIMVALKAALVVATSASVPLATSMGNNVILVDFAAEYYDEHWPEACDEIESELQGLGFAVRQRHSDARGEEARRMALEQLATADNAVAAVSIRRNLESLTADIWLADRVTHKTSMRRLSLQGLTGRAAARLAAMHMVELVHASLIEIRLPQAKEAAAAAPPLVQQLVDAQLPPTQDHATDSGVTFAAGLGVLVPPGRLRSSIGPAAHVQVPVGHELVMVTSGQRTLNATSLHKADANADVALDAARVGLAWRTEFGNRFAVQAGLLGTVLWVRSVGSDGVGLRGGSRSARMAAASAHIAVEVRRNRLGLVLASGVDCVAARLQLNLGNASEASVHGCLASRSLEASWHS